MKYILTLHILKILLSLFGYPEMCLSADRMTNSIDPDQTNLGLHCLLRPIYPNIWLKY